MSEILPVLTTSFIVSSAICVAIGWTMIRKGNQSAHIKWMVSAAILATLFFIIYISRTLFYGNAVFGGPEHIRMYYFLFLVFHIILATTGGVLGIISIYLGYKQSFAKHKKLGPWTATVWFATAITGVTVYLLLYVIYPSGDVDNLFRAIFG
jgi:putative membrane protein